MKFTRNEILEEMKKASNYYEASYGSNLSITLKRLQTKKRIKSPSENIYSLSADEIKELEQILANAD